MRNFTRLCSIAFLALFATSVFAQETKLVGKVDTAANLLGPNDNISVIRFDDPKVPGASCYFSMSNKGGMGSTIGIEEDRSEYVLDCFVSGKLPLDVPANLPTQEVISERSRSAFFKKLYVARIVDHNAGRLVYVAYTRYLIDGSPKQAMSSVPFR